MSIKKTNVEGKDFALALGSKYQYKIRYNRFKKSKIAHKRIDKITEIDVRAFIREQVPKYVAATVKTDVGEMKAAMNLMKRMDLIDKNPFDFNYRNLIPASKSTPVVALTELQWKRMVKLLSDDNTKPSYRWLKPHIVFLKETGLRITEFTGLKYDDVDLKNKMLRVERRVAIPVGESTPHILPLKTKASYATIPLTKEAVKAIKEIMERCKNPQTVDGEYGFFVVGCYGKGIMRVKSIEDTMRKIEALYNKKISKRSYQVSSSRLETYCDHPFYKNGHESKDGSAHFTACSPGYHIKNLY